MALIAIELRAISAPIRLIFAGLYGLSSDVSDKRGVAVSFRPMDRLAITIAGEVQAPTGEMAVTPPSIRKSAPTTYAESSDAR